MATKQTTRGKSKAGKDPRQPKPAICLRLEEKLLKRIKGDAESAERTVPAQIRLILKEHYN